MPRPLKPGEASWNRIILEALTECRYFDIDELFSTCEKKLCKLKAPEKEIALRLFALAFYCDKMHSNDFFQSAAFARFAEVLSFAHFERTVKKLIKKEDPALVVFWTIFRLSLGKNLTLEKKMRFSILPPL